MSHLDDHDLDSLTEEISSELSRTHAIFVEDATVRAALIPFIDTILPGVLTTEQRFGIESPAAEG